MPTIHTLIIIEKQSQSSVFTVIEIQLDIDNPNSSGQRMAYFVA